MNTAITDIFCRAVSYKLSVREAVVLFKLAEDSPVPIGSLSRHCGVTNAGMTMIVGRMEKKRLLKRSMIKGESRSKVFLFLTKRGRDLIEEMLNIKQL